MSQWQFASHLECVCSLETQENLWRDVMTDQWWSFNTFIVVFPYKAVSLVINDYLPYRLTISLIVESEALVFAIERKYGWNDVSLRARILLKCPESDGVTSGRRFILPLEWRLRAEAFSYVAPLFLNWIVSSELAQIRQLHVEPRGLLESAVDVKICER